MKRAFGRQGFGDREAAIADARSEIAVTAEMPFAVMHKDGNYAWLFPLDYARRVSASNGVEIVSVEKLLPPSEVSMT